MSCPSCSGKTDQVLHLEVPILAGNHKKKGKKMGKKNYTLRISSRWMRIIILVSLLVMIDLAWAFGYIWEWYLKGGIDLLSLFAGANVFVGVLVLIFVILKMAVPDLSSEDGKDGRAPK